ncbi:MAG: hypothetical protein RBT74_14670 [Tenuifilaceae bacterium]|jgi:hypothetical protein|nr:hypothetical protein [Tenuifilaceae bacterium]
MIIGRKYFIYPIRVAKLAIILVLLLTSCKPSDDESDPDPQQRSLKGEWYSSRGNLSVLMKDFYGVDSVYFVFREDFTYRMESYGDKKEVAYEGTFAYDSTDFGNVCTIILYQTSPKELTIEGIFEVLEGNLPYTMNYEVIQTLPYIGLYPPSAQEGFGSSDNGAYQHRNIQRYIKIADL